ncbi:hypothetical protein K7W03_10130, partial [Sphingobium sp. PNB]|uniref:hypothetical protein n=1 Tax=Sphingobium sp. PNB TaxID=863934 RepID=UPI001CA410E5
PSSTTSSMIPNLPPASRLSRRGNNRAVTLSVLSRAFLRAGPYLTTRRVSPDGYEGQSGGESAQQGDSVSSGSSRTETHNEGIHLTPLMTPDEIARLFARGTKRQIVITEDSVMALSRWFPTR